MHTHANLFSSPAAVVIIPGDKTLGFFPSLTVPHCTRTNAGGELQPGTGSAYEHARRPGRDSERQHGRPAHQEASGLTDSTHSKQTPTRSPLPARMPGRAAWRGEEKGRKGKGQGKPQLAAACPTPLGSARLGPAAVPCRGRRPCAACACRRACSQDVRTLAPPSGSSGCSSGGRTQPVLTLMGCVRV